VTGGPLIFVAPSMCEPFVLMFSGCTGRSCLCSAAACAAASARVPTLFGRDSLMFSWMLFAMQKGPSVLLCAWIAAIRGS